MAWLIPRLGVYFVYFIIVWNIWMISYTDYRFLVFSLMLKIDNRKKAFHYSYESSIQTPWLAPEYRIWPVFFSVIGFPIRYSSYSSSTALALYRTWVPRGPLQSLYTPFVNRGCSLAPYQVEKVTYDTWKYINNQKTKNLRKYIIYFSASSCISRTILPIVLLLAWGLIALVLLGEKTLSPGFNSI